MALDVVAAVRLWADPASPMLTQAMGRVEDVAARRRVPALA